jgi:hypothetical protein
MPRTPRLPPLSQLSQAQNIASPKWLPTTYALGLSKTVACAVPSHGPPQLQIWARFARPASLFPNVLRQPPADLLT